MKQNIETFKHLNSWFHIQPDVSKQRVLDGTFAKVLIFNVSWIQNDPWLPWSQWKSIGGSLKDSVWDFHLMDIEVVYDQPRLSGNQALTVDKTDPVIYSSANKIRAFGTLLTDGSQQVFSSTTCRRIFHCLPARRLDKNCWRGIRKQIRTTCWCYLIPRYSHVLDFPLWNSPGSHCFPPQMRV